jgi:phosphoribosylaminoimidazolecarboxamide formyltransferase/IMP cyclohydrolase
LLSVTDKSGLEEVADALRSCGYDLIASGGTAKSLRDAGYEVTPVSQVTGFPEIFGGRVKTLHPAVFGGILGPRPEDFAEVADLGVFPIDVVCVNLYRFEETVAEPVGEAEAVEKIDIGGPALLRAAAKNFQRVTVLSDPDFYPEFLAELKAGSGNTTLGFRRRMAAATFARVAAYNRAIAAWLAGTTGQENFRTGGVPLRYGENPHQKAWWQIGSGAAPGTDLAECGLEQLGGKEISYNNLVDLVAAVKLVCDFSRPCCGVIKHTNPCGFGLGPSGPALERALVCDPVSAFGGVIAFNGLVELAAAERLGKMFYEIVAAPSFTDEALAKLRKKKKVRILSFDRDRFTATTRGRSRSFGQLSLHQDEDEGFPEIEAWRQVAGPKLDSETRGALTLAWKVCKHGKSNAVVVGDGTGTLGCGFGQMSRVDSVKIALRKASEQGLDLTGAVAASDGFFPFPDGVEELAGAGVRAVVAPGGSIRDEEVAAAAKQLGITLLFAERRHFNH